MFDERFEASWFLCYQFCYLVIDDKKKKIILQDSDKVLLSAVGKTQQIPTNVLSLQTKFSSNWVWIFSNSLWCAVFVFCYWLMNNGSTKSWSRHALVLSCGLPFSIYGIYYERHCTNLDSWNQKFCFIKRENSM